MMLVTAVVEPRWELRYDAAYRKILEDLGEPVITLSEYREKYKPQVVVVAPPKPSVDAPAAGAAAVAGTTGGQAKAGMSSMGMIVAGVFLAVGCIGIMFMIRGSSSKKRSRRRYAPDSAPVPRAAEKKSAGTKGGKRQRSSQRGGSTEPRRKKSRPRPES
jgi:hypothetical protein